VERLPTSLLKMLLKLGLSLQEGGMSPIDRPSSSTRVELVVKDLHRLPDLNLFQIREPLVERTWSTIKKIIWTSRTIVVRNMNVLSLINLVLPRYMLF